MESLLILLVACTAVVALFIWRETGKFIDGAWAGFTFAAYGGSVVVACYTISKLSSVAITLAGLQ